MNDAVSRTLLYGGGAVVVGGLCWLGFFREVDADYLTLLNSATVHAQLAATIPVATTDVSGRELRARLTAQAESLLVRAERQDPQASGVWQLRGWIAANDARYDDSASCYLRARDAMDVSPADRRRLSIFAAQSCSNAGRFADALALVEEGQAQRSGDELLGADLFRARLLGRMEQTVDAIAVARGVSAAADDGSRVAQEAVSVLAALGDFAGAEAACAHAYPEQPVRDYHVASLKARSGESDNAVRLLESSLESGHPQVRSLLEQDQELWVAVAGESALQRLLEPTVSMPAPGAGH
ncbi:MAG: hypothetical protein IPM29_11380 [Planctomycetes bacterium]|nr:hypothetical protein [Planctomycetota bacterium]